MTRRVLGDSVSEGRGEPIGADMLEFYTAMRYATGITEVALGSLMRRSPLCASCGAPTESSRTNCSYCGRQH